MGCLLPICCGQTAFMRLLPLMGLPKYTWRRPTMPALQFQLKKHQFMSTAALARAKGGNPDERAARLQEALGAGWV